MTARTFLPDHRGGHENHAYQLAQYLISQGHQVGVFHRVLGPEGRDHEVRESEWHGLSIFRLVRNLSNQRLDPYPFYDRRAEVSFESVLAGFQPDLVHMHHFAGLSSSLPATAKRWGLPTLMTLHDFWPMCFLSHLRTPDGMICPGPDQGLRCAECLWKQAQSAYEPVNIRLRLRELGWFESVRRAPRFALDAGAARLAVGRAAYSSAALRTQMVSLAARDTHMREAILACDLIISPSRFLMAKFADWGIPRSRMRHLYNSVPASLRQLCDEEKVWGERIVFGFVGSLYPPKGIHVLVEAFERLGSKDADLQIWGTPPDAAAEPYAASLMERAEAIPNLSFQGGFSPDRLPEILRGIDVLILPSTWYENNPLVILEAFAAGIPVLAGNGGGMAELVQDDVNGLQFRIGDAADLAARMSLALERDRLGRYRSSITPPWSHEELGATVEQIYRDLVDRQRQGSAGDE
jgi:glycosyltransferase involved in cell wall biosynthesis